MTEESQENFNNLDNFELKMVLPVVPKRFV